MNQFHHWRFLSVLIVLIFTVLSLPTLGFSLPPLKVVQLGDSYSAGNGARSSSGERNYHGVEGCYRSPTNWGNQFVDSLRDTFAVTYVNRACSGGVIDEILNYREMDGLKDTYFKTPIEKCPSADYPDEELWHETSDWKCDRRLAPQKDAIDESVDLVVMTGGGNDVRFANIVKQCFAVGFRDPVGCRDAIEFADLELDRVEERLIRTFAELRNKKMRPDARIVFVTYPYLVDDIDYRLNEWGYTYEAARNIRDLGLKGDEVQKAAVEAANEAAGEEFIILFDGTKELFEGHLPNPFQSKAKNPDRWLHEFETRVRMEWYHYNPMGHQNLGEALSIFENFGAASDDLNTLVDVDVAFIIDTTGSMGGEIAQVRTDISYFVAQLVETTNSFRVAIVSYRDYPERTGWAGDYPARVDQTFTSDLTAIQDAINSLKAEGGGDWEESVYSGIKAAINLPWRPGVKKIALVIGDAPALSPEPISNLNSAQIVADSIAVDPVQIFGVNVGNLDSNGSLSVISSNTGGEVLNGTSNLTATISEILDKAAAEPYAWIGASYSGKIGEPIRFDATGSFDPSGLPLSLYEWDFNADGVFEYQSTEPIATWIYNDEFNNFVVVRVTGLNGTALASARTVVNILGYASQGDEVPCELDENGYSITVDEGGRPIRCTADSLPTIDKAGVTESFGTPADIDDVRTNSDTGGGGGCFISSLLIKY